MQKIIKQAILGSFLILSYSLANAQDDSDARNASNELGQCKPITPDIMTVSG